MGTQGKSLIAFGKAAVAFDVHESDYLYLVSIGVETFEQLAFRFPKSEDLETFLVKTVRLKAAYRDEQAKVVAFTKARPLPEQEYKASEDAACLRKLWSLAVSVAKSEIEALANGATDLDPKSKVTAPAAQELEERAVKNRSMPAPFGDRERPSLFTLTKVQQNFSPSGNYHHLNWESFVNQDVEGRLRRAGQLPKDSQELVVSGNELVVKKAGLKDLLVSAVSDVVSMQEALEVRARAFCMLGVAKYETYRRLTEFYVSRLREIPPESFRNPTLNETRRCDRILHEEILKHVSKGEGELQNGITYYLENKDSPFWKLVEFQPEATPDQGRERTRPENSDAAKSAEANLHNEDRAANKGQKRPAESEGQDARRPRQCMVCKTRHEPRCQIPPGFRQEQRALKAQAKKQPAKKGGKGGAGK